MAQTILYSEISDKLPNLTLPQPKFEEQYCRLCLSSCNNQFQDLFSLFNPTRSLVEVIKGFAKVTILQEDEYSKLICCDCFIKLTESENFKCLIINSDLKLRNQQKTYENPSENNIADYNNVFGEDSEHEKIDIDEIDVKKELICDEITENSNCAAIKYIKIEESVEQSVDTNCMTPLKVRKKRIKQPYKHKCSECDKVFISRGNLAKNITVHTRNYPLHCSFCKKGFARKYELEIHETIHTGETRYQCEICGKSVKTHPLLLLHKTTHEGVKPFKCDQCDKTFMSNQYLRLHIANIHSIKTEESTFNCTICSKQYKTGTHLQRHMRRTHKPRELGTCNICGKTVKQLTKHRKTHLKPYKCTVCDQSFGNSEVLKTHLIVHTDQRSFECNICKKTFRFGSSLQKHRKTHDVKNRFKCQFCDKQYNYKISLTAHLKEKHQCI